MEKYRLSPDRVLTPGMVERYLELHRADEGRKVKLHDYYRGNHAILARSFDDATKPNNRVVNPYAQYITDIATGYFMGEPVVYGSQDEKLLNNLTQIYNYNDEASHNSDLACDASIMGEAYELVYLDEDLMLRFKRLEGEYGIPIYDNTVEEELLYFIRYYAETDVVGGNSVTYVEVYSRDDIKTYRRDAGAMILMDEVAHQFGLVPIVIYRNNNEGLGDFESVIPLIDAYDKLDSDSVNDMEYFADAYLKLVGMQGTTEEQIRELKRMRVMLVPEGADAAWLTKTNDDGFVEHLKTRLDNSIHKFSKCPAMTDDDFAGNASGVAMRYKLLGLENMTSKKERAFKKGLQRRIEIICNMLGVMGAGHDYRSITMTFTRNIPANLVEMADVAVKLGDLLSEKARLELLPLDIDYEQNQAEKDEERKAGYLDYAVDDTGQLLGSEDAERSGKGFEDSGRTE
ncbi:MAG: phage portal protein [Clostridia bacterium]|nr:phage portal protein [Clostridia bacterium]